MMRNYKMLLVFSVAAGLLYGCNKDEVKDVPTNAPTEQNTNQQAGENVTDQVPFNFIEFSLDVDYSATESYEVEYENKKNGIESKIEDDRNNEKIQGDEAYTKLEPLFKQLTFDSTTSNDEVIDQVIKVFNITDDYQSIEVEVEFADGTEKEFKRLK
ncbi:MULTISPECIES: YusW family protein [unclassified Lysinibacillus]|uniref:YusW family protein n=1 Tax=unclassified Lysinibacillus TaxID=2636778 RepID=UPI001D173A33|nr:YusW family protein [Lysinibacillus sp. CD3-6]UED79914.1 YusW family protein [Lysinibacillus sp. CD3-6]